MLGQADALAEKLISESMQVGTGNFSRMGSNCVGSIF